MSDPPLLWQGNKEDGAELAARLASAAGDTLVQMEIASRLTLSSDSRLSSQFVSEGGAAMLVGLLLAASRRYARLLAAIDRISSDAPLRFGCPLVVSDCDPLLEGLVLSGDDRAEVARSGDAPVGGGADCVTRNEARRAALRTQTASLMWMLVLALSSLPPGQALHDALRAWPTASPALPLAEPVQLPLVLRTGASESSTTIKERSLAADTAPRLSAATTPASDAPTSAISSATFTTAVTSADDVTPAAVPIVSCIESCTVPAEEVKTAAIGEVPTAIKTTASDALKLDWPTTGSAIVLVDVDDIDGGMSDLSTPRGDDQDARVAVDSGSPRKRSPPERRAHMQADEAFDSATQTLGGVAGFNVWCIAMASCRSDSRRLQASSPVTFSPPLRCLPAWGTLQAAFVATLESYAAAAAELGATEPPMQGQPSRWKQARVAATTQQSLPQTQSSAEWPSLLECLRGVSASRAGAAVTDAQRNRWRSVLATQHSVLRAVSGAAAAAAAAAEATGSIGVTADALEDVRMSAVKGSSTVGAGTPSLESVSSPSPSSRDHGGGTLELKSSPLSVITAALAAARRGVIAARSRSALRHGARAKAKAAGKGGIDRARATHGARAKAKAAGKGGIDRARATHGARAKAKAAGKGGIDRARATANVLNGPFAPPLALTLALTALRSTFPPDVLHYVMILSYKKEYRHEEVAKLRAMTPTPAAPSRSPETVAAAVVSEADSVSTERCVGGVQTTINVTRPLDDGVARVQADVQYTVEQKVTGPAMLSEASSASAADEIPGLLQVQQKGQDPAASAVESLAGRAVLAVAEAAAAARTSVAVRPSATVAVPAATPARPTSGLVQIQKKPRLTPISSTESVSAMPPRATPTQVITPLPRKSAVASLAAPNAVTGSASALKMRNASSGNPTPGVKRARDAPDSVAATIGKRRPEQLEAPSDSPTSSAEGDDISVGGTGVDDTDAAARPVSGKARRLLGPLSQEALKAAERESRRSAKQARRMAAALAGSGVAPSTGPSGAHASTAAPLNGADKDIASGCWTDEEDAEAGTVSKAPSRATGRHSRGRETADTDRYTTGKGSGGTARTSAESVSRGSTAVSDANEVLKNVGHFTEHEFAPLASTTSRLQDPGTLMQRLQQTPGPSWANQTWREVGSEVRSTTDAKCLPPLPPAPQPLRFAPSAEPNSVAATKGRRVRFRGPQAAARSAPPVPVVPVHVWAPKAAKDSVSAGISEATCACESCVQRLGRAVVDVTRAQSPSLATVGVAYSWTSGTRAALEDPVAPTSIALIESKAELVEAGAFAHSEWGREPGASPNSFHEVEMEDAERDNPKGKSYDIQDDWEVQPANMPRFPWRLMNYQFNFEPGPPRDAQPGDDTIATALDAADAIWKDYTRVLELLESVQYAHAAKARAHAAEPRFPQPRELPRFVHQVRDCDLFLEVLRRHNPNASVRRQLGGTTEALLAFLEVNNNCKVGRDNGIADADGTGAPAILHGPLLLAPLLPIPTSSHRSIYRHVHKKQPTVCCQEADDEPQHEAVSDSWDNHLHRMSYSRASKVHAEIGYEAPLGPRPPSTQLDQRQHLRMHPASQIPVLKQPSTMQRKEHKQLENPIQKLAPKQELKAMLKREVNQTTTVEEKEVTKQQEKQQQRKQQQVQVVVQKVPQMQQQQPSHPQLQKSAAPELASSNPPQPPQLPLASPPQHLKQRASPVVDVITFTDTTVGQHVGAATLSAEHTIPGLSAAADHVPELPLAIKLRSFPTTPPIQLVRLTPTFATAVGNVPQRYHRGARNHAAGHMYSQQVRGTAVATAVLKNEFPTLEAAVSTGDSSPVMPPLLQVVVGEAVSALRTERSVEYWAWAAEPTFPDGTYPSGWKPCDHTSASRQLHDAIVSGWEADAMSSASSSLWKAWNRETASDAAGATSTATAVGGTAAAINLHCIDDARARRRSDYFFGAAHAGATGALSARLPFTIITTMIPFAPPSPEQQPQQPPSPPPPPQQPPQQPQQQVPLLQQQPKEATSQVDDDAMDIDLDLEDSAVEYGKVPPDVPWQYNVLVKCSSLPPMHAGDLRWVWMCGFPPNWLAVDVAVLWDRALQHVVNIPPPAFICLEPYPTRSNTRKGVCFWYKHKHAVHAVTGLQKRSTMRIRQDANPRNMRDRLVVGVKAVITYGKPPHLRSCEGRKSHSPNDYALLVDHAVKVFPSFSEEMLSNNPADRWTSPPLQSASSALACFEGSSEIRAALQSSTSARGTSGAATIEMLSNDPADRWTSPPLQSASSALACVEGDTGIRAALQSSLVETQRHVYGTAQVPTVEARAGDDGVATDSFLPIQLPNVTDVADDPDGAGLTSQQRESLSVRLTQRVSFLNAGKGKAKDAYDLTQMAMAIDGAVEFIRRTNKLPARLWQQVMEPAVYNHVVERTVGMGNTALLTSKGQLEWMRSYVDAHGAPLKDSLKKVQAYVAPKSAVQADVVNAVSASLLSVRKAYCSSRAWSRKGIGAVTMTIMAAQTALPVPLAKKVASALSLNEDAKGAPGTITWDDYCRAVFAQLDMLFAQHGFDAWMSRAFIRDDYNRTNDMLCRHMTSLGSCVYGDVCFWRNWHVESLAVYNAKKAAVKSTLK